MPVVVTIEDKISIQELLLKDTKILIVDDEPDLAELLSFEFEILGCKISTANSAADALELCRKQRFDVVISDIRMPEKDGVSFLRELRTIDPKEPVVLLMTGFADISLEDSYNLGAAAIFGKPFDRNKLVNSVAKLRLPINDRWKWDIDDVDAVEIQAQFESLNEAVSKHKFDLGHGGFYLYLTENFPQVSQNIKFEIRFGTGPFETFMGVGIVRWSQKKGVNQGIGVEICGLSDQSLADYLSFSSQIKGSAYIPKPSA